MEPPPEEDLIPPSPSSSSSSSSSSSVTSPFSPPSQPPRKVPRTNLASPHPQVGLSSPSQRRDVEQGNSSDRGKQIEEVKSLGPSSEKKPLTSSDQFTMPGILCHGENVKPPEPAQIMSRIKSRLGNAPDDSRPSQDTKPANILGGSSRESTNVGGPSGNFTTSSHPVPSNLAANFLMNQAAINSVIPPLVCQDIVRSCYCRTSNCVYKYCGCVKAEVACSTFCGCQDCQNLFGRRPPYGP